VKDRIRDIIKSAIQCACLDESASKAADEIVALLEQWPVGTLRAMAALVKPHSWAADVYIVPDVDGPCVVEMRTEDFGTCTCLRGNCEHVQAVLMYLAQQ
jgi:hypothetical protein